MDKKTPEEKSILSNWLLTEDQVDNVTYSPWGMLCLNDPFCPLALLVS